MQPMRTRPYKPALPAWPWFVRSSARAIPNERRERFARQSGA